MLDQINNILGKIDNFVWGVPLIVLILLVGIFLTIRLKGLQIRKLPLAVKYLFEKKRVANPAKYPVLQHFALHYQQP